MKLIEREQFLAVLVSGFEKVFEGEGHCVFVSGEAGIGKTSLIKAFCKRVKNKCNIYQGTCDALFTPRPLAPLYDILLQLGENVQGNNVDINDRTEFFTSLFRELDNKDQINIVVFEDIHWADEATLDFIKFFARRITQLQCLFILTYRDTQIHPAHPLRNITGQLDPDSFTRLQLLPLSQQAVKRLANEKGFNGEDVYRISGGNPFYVNEILASYSLGVPDNIKDSVLSIYNSMCEKTKEVWQILSVVPVPFEIEYLNRIDPSHIAAIQNCMDAKILLVDNGRVFFKHELYRRTIEDSLSPFVRIALNKKILDLLLEGFEKKQETERIIHHAKNANEYDIVVHYAPIAARQAASVGAHIEAARLFLTAIEYYHGKDEDALIQFYESYAYECYLTYQIKEAIVYTERSLCIWKKKNQTEKIGNCLRFLSRLSWLKGNRKKAESFGEQAIEVFANEPSTRAKAMALSNMSQLKMLYHQQRESIHWGEKAIAMAKELSDEETLCHALNNVGTAQMLIKSLKQQGIEHLEHSLEMALKNSYHEHAARAYTNLGSNNVVLKKYGTANKFIEEGLQYCEERNLDSWKTYLLVWKARLKLETGNWKEAGEIADNILKNEGHAPYVKVGALSVTATIKIRKGAFDEAIPLMLEAKSMAFETMELQRMLPVLSTLLEYEWITGIEIVEQPAIDTTINLLKELDDHYEQNEFAFWLKKARKQKIGVKEIDEFYEINSEREAHRVADLLNNTNCPYEEAISLFEGNDDDKRRAISIVHELGANAVYEKLKLEMRRWGIKNIPRGFRKTTQSNPEFLTDRELDVLRLLHEGLHNKEIAARLYISAKTVDHHISSILYKLEVNSRTKAVHESSRRGILK